LRIALTILIIGFLIFQIRQMELFNFNGVVSLLIASIELVLILNLLLVSEKNHTNRLALALLFLLFAYQLLEFLICYTGTTSNTPVYLALTVITFLPPLGLYFINDFYQLHFKGEKLLFLPAVLFSVYYLLNIGETELVKCTAIYAAYKYPAEFLYGIFYYLPIWAVFVILPWQYVKIKDNNTKKRLTLILTIGWYLTFTPTFIVLYISDTYRFAVESILCKQAFILALTLAYFIINNRERKKISDENVATFKTAEAK